MWQAPFQNRIISVLSHLIFSYLTLGDNWIPHYMILLGLARLSTYTHSFCEITVPWFRLVIPAVAWRISTFQEKDLMGFKSRLLSNSSSHLNPSDVYRRLFIKHSLRKISKLWANWRKQKWKRFSMVSVKLEHVHNIPA